MEFVWRPHPLRVLTQLQHDPAYAGLLGRLAETLGTISAQLSADTGAGEAWILPVTDTGWVVMCSNDRSGVMVVTYLGPKLG